MKTFIRDAWHWWWDFAARWVQPSLGLIALVSGTLISFDFAKLRVVYPKWAGLFDILGSGVFFWAFLFSAIAAFAIGLGLSWREKTMADLRSKVAKHRSEVEEIGNNIINVFDGLLLNLGRKLGLQQSDQVRISLYVHDPEHCRFIPCGRYSPNPTLGGPGRTSYPDNQGCIFEGWKRGWHFDNEVPPSGVPRRTYNKNNYNVPEAINTSIRMTSCLYAVKRLYNALGQAVAVLVVEAIESNHFKADELQASLDGVADDLSRIGLHAARIHTQSVQGSRKRAVMALLHDVMAYLIQKYPSHIGHELSNARLTKMVYLADWHQAIAHKRQITDIKWYFDNFGPFVRDIETTAAFRSTFLQLTWEAICMASRRKRSHCGTRCIAPV